MTMRRSTLWLSAALAALALSATAPLSEAASPEVMGHVATVFGDAVALRPGETPRPLECGAPVFEGEQVKTGPASRVGLLLGDVLHHLGERSTLALARTPEGAPDVTLQEGSVRVLDPRDSGPQAGLSVLDARATILGNDSEAYVFTEKVGRYAMLCEWDRALPVARDRERAIVEPGRCVLAKPKEPLYLADAHDERMGTPARDFCDIGPVIGALDDRFSPSDVAAGPPSLFAPAPPGPPDAGPRSPCDEPGSGCTAVLGAAGGMVGVPPPSGGPGGGIGGGSVGVPPPSGGPGGGIGVPPVQ